MKVERSSFACKIPIVPITRHFSGHNYRLSVRSTGSFVSTIGTGTSIEQNFVSVDYCLEQSLGEVPVDERW